MDAFVPTFTALTSGPPAQCYPGDRLHTARLQRVCLGHASTDPKVLSECFRESMEEQSDVRDDADRL